MARTLMIVKPDAVSRNLIGEVVRRVELAGFRVLELKMTRLTRSQAEEFYSVHRDRSFFKDLLDFMTSDRVVPMVLEREDAVAHLRKVIGATDPAKADPGTIRKDFATNVQCNAVHASDSPDNAVREIGFFFGAGAATG